MHFSFRIFWVLPFLPYHLFRYLYFLFPFPCQPLVIKDCTLRGVLLPAEIAEWCVGEVKPEKMTWKLYVLTGTAPERSLSLRVSSIPISECRVLGSDSSLLLSIAPAVCHRDSIACFPSAPPCLSSLTLVKRGREGIPAMTRVASFDAVW